MLLRNAVERSRSVTRRLGYVLQPPLTVRHRFDFGEHLVGVDELTASAWDALRLSDSPFGFTVPEPAAIARRAQVIAKIIEERGARRICSYGVGTALLERRLLNSAKELVCTEYAEKTRLELAKTFPAVVEHDLRDGPLPGFDLHLLHRVDTELPDDEWRRYFARATEPHLIVVTSFLTLKEFRAEQIRRWKGATKAGWLRTERQWRRLLPDGWQRVQIADLPGFLTPS